MATSSSINLSPKIKFSDRLFFDQYRYCVRAGLHWVEACRGLNEDRIKHLIEMWDTHSYYRKKINYGGSWRDREYFVPQTLEPRLVIANQWFVEHVQDIKLQFLRDKVFVYTNDTKHPSQMADLDVFDNINITEIRLDRPRGTVKARYPGFQVRAYFRPTHITQQQRDSLVNFLNTNEAELRTNIGLERFINQDPKRFNYLTLRDYFFVDLRDERLLSVLELMCPGIVRKTMDIIYDDK